MARRDSGERAHRRLGWHAERKHGENGGREDVDLRGARGDHLPLASPTDRHLGCVDPSSRARRQATPVEQWPSLSQTRSSFHFHLYFSLTWGKYCCLVDTPGGGRQVACSPPFSRLDSSFPAPFSLYRKSGARDAYSRSRWHTILFQQGGYLEHGGVRCSVECCLESQPSQHRDGLFAPPLPVPHTPCISGVSGPGPGRNAPSDVGSIFCHSSSPTPSLSVCLFLFLSLNTCLFSCILRSSRARYSGGTVSALLPPPAALDLALHRISLLKETAETTFFRDAILSSTAKQVLHNPTLAKTQRNEARSGGNDLNGKSCAILSSRRTNQQPKMSQYSSLYNGVCGEFLTCLSSPRKNMDIFQSLQEELVAFAIRVLSDRCACSLTARRVHAVLPRCTCRRCCRPSTSPTTSNVEHTERRKSWAKIIKRWSGRSHRLCPHWDELGTGVFWGIRRTRLDNTWPNTPSETGRHRWFTQVVPITRQRQMTRLEGKLKLHSRRCQRGQDNSLARKIFLHQEIAYRGTHHSVNVGRPAAPLLKHEMRIEFQRPATRKQGARGSTRTRSGAWELTRSFMTNACCITAVSDSKTLPHGALPLFAGKGSSFFL